MIDTAYVSSLQRRVKVLTEDLRKQVAGDAGLRSELRKEHAAAFDGQRTGGTFETWLEDVLDQAAVAWVLGCIFVRFCEDNQLVDGLWLGGPDDRAPVERALQHRQQHLISNPRENDRHWLRAAFTHLRSLRATGKIFDDHNPVWRFDISGQAAEELSDFFRRGDGLRSLHSEQLDTRFLGDLYEKLSIHAQKTYALLQTPEFVESFILDRTFEPAYKEFGLAGTTVIDPTCGSGHFLLGAFDRLITRWKEREPNTDVRELTQRALHQVTGVDINPFAVAIARFRLMVAALKECKLSSLERAPAFDIRVAAGDSLLPWAGETGMEQTDVFLWQTDKPFAFTSEDEDLLAEYLKPRQYTVVVGNPPYIVVRDQARNKRYRELYPTVCHRQYQLTVPFAKRFFDLAVKADQHGEGGGHVGQITANAFMKREFGTKLINDYFAHKVELTEVIDTSGAYIPGHGTPTVILIGRHSDRRRSATIRTVLGIRGEPSQPDEPADGLVWHAIIAQIDRPKSESTWISVSDPVRDAFKVHPWNLAGGGSAELLESLQQAKRLGHITFRIGFFGDTHADEAFTLPAGGPLARSAEELLARASHRGDQVRDWLPTEGDQVTFPYDGSHSLLSERQLGVRFIHFYWPLRATLWSRGTFGGGTYRSAGRMWWEWHQLPRDSESHSWSIAFAEVATHNHFVLDRGGKVFNRTAPVIKLPEGATEDEHLRLLGVLNSSTACFWLKQVSYGKGNGGIGGGIGDESWEPRYQFGATKLQEFPLPAAYPLARARLLDELAQRLGTLTPAAVAAEGVPTRQRLAEAAGEYAATRAQMIAVQEELDWEAYRLYGLLDDDLTTEHPPELRLGERTFEIIMARNREQTEWFNRHGSTAITELPGHWPDAYKALVERRIAAIEGDRNLGLLERPEHKRRWSTDGWDAMQTRALRDWLLDRLEAPELWGGAPTPLSVAQLADRVRHDDDFRAVLDLWVGSDQHDLVKTLTSLVADEHVPYLPAQRYKPTGLRKRAQWERTWALQRREDAGETVTIEVPPKYTTADFSKGSYWRNRGKLDVPKERFISYPDAGREGDSSLLLGWAGWDHLRQAQALATVYLDRKNQAAWPRQQLLPLLAGVAEQEPWLHQWHTDPQPGFPGTPAQFFTGLIDTELAVLGADRAELTTLRGVEELA